MNRPIKNESDYLAALRDIESIIDRDVRPGTPDADALDVLTVLVKDYENKQFPVVLPSPLEAIKFRMEQQRLSPRDLIPYIGGRSKVSEILSGKRPLTLAMIRALNTGLGIPAEALIHGADKIDETLTIEWDRFPIREMVDRGYFKQTTHRENTDPERLLRDFLKPVGSLEELAPLYRRGQHIRSARDMDEYALMAWNVRVVTRATDVKTSGSFHLQSIDAPFVKELVQLSAKPDGPLLACELLRRIGITLIVEPHLPHTFVDGATLFFKQEHPIIGLTLRHDRLDNFWFTLLHELGHIILHFKSGITEFIDDLDYSVQTDTKEREADHFAGQALIPEEAWKKSPASRLRSPDAAQHLAAQLGIHPAIVAGRMRKEFNAYRLLNNVIGHGQVRRLFTGSLWQA